MPSKTYTVARALTEDLEPTLAVDGFLKLKPKNYVRMTNGVVQFLSVSVVRECLIAEHGSMPLFVPSESFVMTLGGRFPDAKGKMYEAQTEELMRRSVREISTTYEASYRAWFDATSTVSGLMALDRALRAKDPDRIFHHDDFRFGCCHAFIDEIDVARELVTSAREKYLAETMPGRAAWAKPIAERCDQLLSALANGNHRELLGSWMAFTTEKLGLSGAKPLKQPRPQS